MRKIIALCLTFVLVFCFSFTSCDSHTAVRANSGEEGITNLSQTGSEEKVSDNYKNTSENTIRADYENMKDRLSAELLREKENDKIFTSVPPAYADFDKLERDLQVAYEIGDETSIFEINQKLSSMDPDGDLAEYQFKRYRAEENYGAYAYFTSPTSPYFDGVMPSEKEDFPTYESIFDQTALTKWPRGYLNVLASDVSFEAVPIGTASKEIALKDVYTKEQMEKEGYAEDAVTKDFAILMRVTECYWGGLEIDDVIAFAPCTIDQKLVERMALGESWLIFASFDGMNVEADGKQYTTISTRTEGVFLVESDKVYSASPYKDLQQYAGISPLELVKKGIEIWAKYGNGHLGSNI